MLFRTYGQAILTLHERYSRIRILSQSGRRGKAASPIASAMAAILAPLPTVWRQTITFDNGTEFARHHELHALGKTFFCDTYSPWQKGGVENAIGRMPLPAQGRRFTQMPGVQQYSAQMPRLSDSGRDIRNKVLRFKCESTFRPSPEETVIRPW